MAMRLLVQIFPMGGFEARTPWTRQVDRPDLVLCFHQSRRPTVQNVSHRNRPALTPPIARAIRFGRTGGGNREL